MTEPDLEALEQAARPVRERIRRDTATAPPALAKILAALQERLFEPRLTIRAVLEACRLRDRFLPVRFHETLGLPPAQYLRIARLEVACRLLRDTELSVARIAELVGYERPDSLSDALAAWEGLRPTRLRPLLREQRSDGRRAVASSSASGAPDSLRRRLEEGRFVGGLSDLCDLRLGRVSAKDLRALRDHIRALYSRDAEYRPDSDIARPSEQAGDVDWERLDSTFAAELWVEAELLPEDARRDYLLRFHFTSPALFWLLLSKSREVGRQGRRRGVPLAELALESLDRVAWDARPKGERQRLEALGWAWLSNAHCAAFELAEAGAALRKAEALAPTETTGEIGLIRARLLWYRRQLPETVVTDRPKGPTDVRHKGPTRKWPKTGLGLLVSSIVKCAPAARAGRCAQQVISLLSSTLCRCSGGGFAIRR